MTQITERVARGIFTFVYLWGEEQTDEGRAEAHAAWENLQEKPSLSSTDNKQKYRNYAQAALEEIKLDDLVGALKNSTNTIEYLSMDIEHLMSAAMTEEMELVKSNRALLSELEKTE